MVIGSLEQMNMSRKQLKRGQSYRATRGTQFTNQEDTKKKCPETYQC